MTEERAIVVQRMIAAWNADCNVSTSVEDHMAAALGVAVRHCAATIDAFTRIQE